MTEAPHEYEFDVAVSFAGEDRQFVSEIVESLKPELKIFYDEDFVVEAWGKDGVEYFTDVFMNRARYAVIFVSKDYLEKMWTRLERRAALSRAATEKNEYVLPIQLDNTKLPGLLPTAIYLDARRFGIQGLISAIAQKAGVRQGDAVVIAPKDRITRVPRTQAEIDQLLEERPNAWEYLLYGGVIHLGMKQLEGKYRDHAIRYARSNGITLDKDELHKVSATAFTEGLQISSNFNAALAKDAQEAAFGKQGEPGDPDRIVHIATRFVSCYESFLDWSANILGYTIANEKGRAAFAVLARVTDPCIENIRKFEIDFVRESDTLVERLEAGDQVVISMTVTLELDDESMADYERKIANATV